MRIFVVLVCSVFFASSLGQELVVERDPAADTARVIIPTPDGIVDWRDVALGIARAEGLDDEAIAGLLPQGTSNLNSVLAQLSVHGLNIALGPGVDLEMQFGPATIEALVVDIDRHQFRASLSQLKGIVRQVVFQWDSRADSPYGLFLDEDWQQLGADRPLVIMIHGYSSGPELFSTLRGQLREVDLAAGVFVYPNDSGVTASGHELAAALVEFERQHPDQLIYLVGHSMGGLVARIAIEDPAGPVVGNVGRLIMVGTPNQGSNLARFPVSFDVWEHLFDGIDSLEAVFFDAVLDGLNEARHDLQPGSVAIDRLNGFARNDDVRYTLLLGNQGPLSRQQLAELRRWLGEMTTRSVVLEALEPRLDELFVDLDELVDGYGDGIVAVDRGRLPGVDDTLVLPFRHNAISAGTAAGRNSTVFAEVLRRLED